MPAAGRITAARGQGRRKRAEERKGRSAARWGGSAWRKAERSSPNASRAGTGCRAQRGAGSSAGPTRRACPRGPARKTRRAPHTGTGKQANTQSGKQGKRGKSTPPGSQTAGRTQSVGRAPSHAPPPCRPPLCRATPPSPRRRLAAATDASPRLQSVLEPRRRPTSLRGAPRARRHPTGTWTGCQRRRSRIQRLHPAATGPCSRRIPLSRCCGARAAALRPQPRGHGPANGRPVRAGKDAACLLPRRNEVARAQGVPSGAARARGPAPTDAPAAEPRGVAGADYCD